MHCLPAAFTNLLSCLAPAYIRSLFRFLGFEIICIVRWPCSLPVRWLLSLTLWLLLHFALLAALALLAWCLFAYYAPFLVSTILASSTVIHSFRDLPSRHSRFAPYLIHDYDYLDLDYDTAFLLSVQ
jgi:hypothetical protein